MGLDYAAQHAVETLLSGPAASALGGSTLAQANQAVIVDMGGTTTDIALIENGLPLHEFLTLNRKDWHTLSLTEQERQLCAHLEHGATSVEQAAQTLGIDKYNPPYRMLRAHRHHPSRRTDTDRHHAFTR